MIHGLSTDFAAEVKAKQESLDVTQAHLRAATRELAEQRKQIQTWQGKCGELDMASQRIRNLERALADDESFDWSSRSAGPLHSLPLASAPSSVSNGNGVPTPSKSGDSSTSVPLDPSLVSDPDPAIPTDNSIASLIKLRRMKLWQDRMERLLEERLRKLQGASAEKEFQYKKIIALCTGVPTNEIEGVSVFSSDRVDVLRLIGIPPVARELGHRCGKRSLDN